MRTSEETASTGGSGRRRSRRVAPAEAAGAPGDSAGTHLPQLGPHHGGAAVQHEHHVLRERRQVSGREVVHEIAVENLAEGARGQDGSSGDRQRTSGDARAAQPPKVEASTKLRVGSGSRPRARIPGPAPPRERIANVICIRIKSPLKNVPTVLTDAILIIHPLSLPPPTWETGFLHYPVFTKRLTQ